MKKKENTSLTLDEEFLQYCEINGIEDIEKLAKETFKKGFDLLKYGTIPASALTKKDKDKLDEPPVIQTKAAKIMVENRYVPVDAPIKKEEPKIVEAIPMKSSDGTEAFTKIAKNVEKKDLYDE